MEGYCETCSLNEKVPHSVDIVELYDGCTYGGFACIECIIKLFDDEDPINNTYFIEMKSGVALAKLAREGLELKKRQYFQKVKRAQ